MHASVVHWKFNGCSGVIFYGRPDLCSLCQKKRIFNSEFFLAPLGAQKIGLCLLLLLPTGDISKNDPKKVTTNQIPKIGNYMCVSFDTDCILRWHM